MYESKIDLAGYGNEAYSSHEGFECCAFSAAFMDELTAVLMSGQDGDKIQTSRNEKRHHPRNWILDSQFI
jgi:hypothetical protein